MSLEKVQTRFGEVSIETVDCDSCGATVAKEEAAEFALGERSGHACEHCVDTGPISFPDWEAHTVDNNGIKLFLLATVFWPIATVFSLLAYTDTGSDEPKGYFVGSIGAIVWLGIPLGIILLL